MSSSDKPGVPGELPTIQGNGITLNYTTGEVDFSQFGLIGFQERPTWKDIEESGVKGIPLLRQVIGAIQEIPIPVEIDISDPGEFDIFGTECYMDIFGTECYMTVTYHVPDAYNSADKQHRQKFMATVPGSCLPFFPEVTARQWAAWLFQCLAFIAVHEVAEFFVVGGNRLFDPHDKGKDLRLIEVTKMPWDFPG